MSFVKKRLGSPTDEFREQRTDRWSDSVGVCGALKLELKLVQRVFLLRALENLEPFFDVEHIKP